VTFSLPAYSRVVKQNVEPPAILTNFLQPKRCCAYLTRPATQGIAAPSRALVLAVQRFAFDASIASPPHGR